MVYEKHEIFEWTDGGNPANCGYFDGSGDLDYLLQKIFGKVMEDIKYGTKCKVTFKIETEDKAR